MIKEPKILLLDIETAPNVGYTWGKWEQDVIEFVDQWYILSFAYKWLGRKTRVQAICDFEGYKPGTKDQKLLKPLWDLLNEADIVVAQNGDRFDIRKINTRFLLNRMPPPSPYKTVDTLKLARTFAFNSNKLNDLGRALGVGEKVKHQGFELWLGCMAGDKHSWTVMKKYNLRDVDLLERIYLCLRPWHKNHPNMGILSDGATCPKCGADKIQKRGLASTKTMIYARYQCLSCGGWSRAVAGVRSAHLINA